MKPDMDRLNILNFALGIRAKEINENFDLLRYWIEAERLRTGGWGIVEGFDLTKELPARIIHVSEGTLIDRNGQEVHVDAKTFPPVNILHHSIGEILTTDASGLLTLSYPAYSNHFQHVVYYAPGQHVNESDFLNEFPQEFKIYVADTNRQLNFVGDIVYIKEKEVQLRPEWANRELRVEYMYADDRFDAIFVRKEEHGNRYYDDMIPTGIISTSPSIQEVQDYYDRDWFLIGFAYWHVGQEIDVEFFTGDRMYRRVYVDRNNILYLNGKPYEQKTIIYFEEPRPPVPNDLWYCIEDEILYIWRPGEEGEYGWQPVNDLARGITCTYQFSKETNPEDLQTFDFFAHPEIFFMPGKHQVTVIIDQVVIMEDQYDELYFNKDRIEELDQNRYQEQYQQMQKHLCGYGIKLKCPLERPSIVEIRVSHDLSTRKHNDDLFQHEHLFMSSGTITIEDPTNTVFSVNAEYEPDAGQLEVFKNGLRLAKGVHYQEVPREGSNVFCDRFQMLSPLEANDVLVFRVMRTVSSYANLKLIIQEYEDQLEELQNNVNTQVASITDSQNTITENYETLRSNVTSNTERIDNLSDIALTTVNPVTAEQLDPDIQQYLIMGKIDLQYTTETSELFLSDVRAHDFITVSYSSNEDSDPIVLSEARGDYEIYDEDDGAVLRLGARWLNNIAAKLYITGLKIGAR